MTPEPIPDAPVPRGPARPLMRHWSAFAALIGAAGALTALTGWVVDVPRLRSILPGAVEMKVNTALAFLFASTALLTALAARSPLGRHVAQLLAACVGVVGAATLSEYAFGWNLGIDELLIADTATAFNAYRGRMSPYTALAFVALAVAIGVLASGRWRPVKWVCGWLVVAVGAVSLVGYLWNAQELTTDHLVPPVAVNTAVVFLLLGFGTLYAGHRAWALRVRVRPTSISPVEQKIVAGLFLALALLFVGGGYTYRATVGFESAMNAFAARQDARVALAQIHDLIGDAQFAYEGYVLDGRPQHLALYNARIASLEAPMALLESRLGPDRLTTVVLADFRADLQAWVGRMTRDLQQVQRITPEARAERVEAAARDPARQGTLDGIDSLDRYQAERQTKQRANAAHLREFTLASLLLTLAVASTLCILLFRAVQRAGRLQAVNRHFDSITRRAFGLLATTLDSHEALDGTLGALREIRPDGTFAFYTLEGESLLVREVVHGAAEALPAQAAMGEGVIGRAALSRFGILAEEGDGAAAKHPVAPRFHLYASPILYFDRVIGVLACRSSIAFRSHEQALIARVADALGVALNNLRQYADLQRVSQQLSTKNNELRQQAGELDQANRMKTEFLATMSHELRTPLNAIIGFAEVLRENLVGELTPQQREYVGDILDSGEHLLALINDILDLSKVEAGKMELDLEPIDLDPLLSGSLAMVKEKALAHRLSLSATIEPDLAPMWADRRKLKQMIYNLLSNAVKFTTEGGSVVLAARLAGGDAGPTIEISVRDTGIGIAPADQVRLFQPFVQIDGSLGKQFQGTGLGLAMIKRLAELHGGSVTLESTVGVGSTFTIRLPYRCEEGVPEVEGSMLSSPPARKRLALVVDLTSPLAERVGQDLAAAGFEVQHVQASTAALQSVAFTRADLVVLDAALDEKTRATAVTALQADPRIAGAPTVMLSLTRDDDSGHAVGSAAVLGTSIVRDDLRAALAALGMAADPRGTITALVVDDEPRVAEILDAYLQAAGCNVARATNGADALHAVRTLKPDVVVLDLIMPEMTGFDVIREMKAAAATRMIPIVVISAKTLSAADRGALAGVEKVLRKSEFRRDDFVREVMRAAASPAVEE